MELKSQYKFFSSYGLDLIFQLKLLKAESELCSKFPWLCGLGPTGVKRQRSRRKQQCPHQLTKLWLPLFASSHNGFDFTCQCKITISTIVLLNKINRAQCPTAVSQNWFQNFPPKNALQVSCMTPEQVI